MRKLIFSPAVSAEITVLHRVYIELLSYYVYRRLDLAYDINHCCTTLILLLCLAYNTIKTDLNKVLHVEIKFNVRIM